MSITAERTQRDVVPSSSRERWTLLVASIWLVAGLQLDAYAHATIPELETFWTPWHGVLYSGIAASGLTLLWIVRRRLPGIPTYRSVLALPNALRVPLIGMAALLAGGGVDALWHNIWGIEQGLEIFVSPSHEFIIVGMVLVPIGPALMLAAEPVRRLGVGGGFLVTISTLLSVLPLHIYSLHASVLGQDNMLGSGVDAPRVHGPDALIVHGYLVSTILLVVPIIALGRRWSLPIGVPALLVAVPAVLMHLMFSSANPWWPELTVAVAAFVAEAVLRVAMAVVPLGTTGRWVAFGIIAPPAVWGALLVVGSAQRGSTGFNIHMLTGLLTYTALAGLAAVLVTRGVHRSQAE